MSTDVPPAVPLPPAPLPDDPTLLKAMLAELLATLRQRDQELEHIRHRLDLLLRRLYGPRAEKFDPAQPSLFDDVPPQTPALPPVAPAPAAEAPAPQRGHGRRRLPDSLPRLRFEHTLSPTECACPACGTTRTRIAEDSSEQLDYKPAALFVVEHIRHVYACPRCQGQLVTAPRPDAAIDRGLPGAGLLAHIAVSKYLDHLPLHRLERIFGRHGLELPRSTTCGWMAQLAELVRPAYELMRREVLGSRVVQTDDTIVPVQDKSREHCRQARAWVYLGDQAHPFTVFDYTPDRSRDGPAQFLGNYQGFLQADAYAGYDQLFAAGKVVEVGCWAHARRKFYDHKDAAPELAHEALARIAQLYAVEKQARERGLDADAVRALRQQQSLPLLTALRQWLLERQPELLPKNPLRGAIDYCLNQWAALTRFTEEGWLSIDNNAAERALRGVAVGRKNWLFAGSDAGGRTAAVLFSLTASCHQAGVDAFAWLRALIVRFSAGPVTEAELRELLPDRWHAALPPA